jgi:cellulose synthase (UDP-forming)
VQLARMRSVLRNRRLGDVLVASGALTDRQLRKLLDLQASREAAWVRLGELAVEEGYISNSQLAAALSLPESRRPLVAVAS